tara:strand:- start:218 stop:427 length:210 start_codon:yes stop_codon:yes gene_type:complete
MDNNCVHCSNPNPERWFYCRSCGKKSSETKYSTNMWMRTERGKRTDMEFRNITMDQHIKEVEESKNASR